MTKRRDNGSGSVYREGKGWRAEVTIDGRTHKPRARTKADALAKIAALRRQHESGIVVDGRRTVGDVLDLWEARTLPNRDVAPSSTDTYRSLLRALHAEFGSVLLAALDVARVERGLDRIATGKYGKGKPLSRRSVKYARSTLGQALDVAMKQRWIAYNPARLADLTPSAPKAKGRKSLTIDEAETLWAALEGERLGNYFRLLLTTGLRPGEALGLCDDAVDLDAGVLHVWRVVRRNRGRAELVDLVKTEASYRTIGLPPPAVDVLRAQRREVAALKLAARSWATDDRGLIFPTATGGPWSDSNVRREMARICAKAGLWDVRPYELRHSCASILNDRGVALEDIADLLGNDIATTSGTYRHRLRPSADGAVDVMDNLFGAGRA